MEIVKLLIIAVFACFLVALVSQYKPEFSLLIQITAVVAVVIILLDSAAEIFSQLQAFSKGTKINNEYINLLIKALVIAISGKVICDICSDTGNRAIATCVELGCKISIMLLAVPMLKALAQLAATLVKQ